jgi:hypothetical protein
MSDGCVATQNGECPRIAMFPVSAPGSVAWQPDPRLALVARHSDFLEVRAPGALQQVPADGGYVTDLTGGPPIVDLDDTRLPFDDHGDLTFIVLVRTSSGLLYEGEGVAEVGWSGSLAGQIGAHLRWRC